MKQLELKVSRELWESLTAKQQQDQRDRFIVTVALNYAPAHELPEEVA